MTQAKKASEMTQDEYKQAKIRATDPSMVSWPVLARTIREMNEASLQAFEIQYSIAIVPDTSRVVPYSKMGPTEKKVFETIHNIESPKVKAP